MLARTDLTADAPMMRERSLTWMLLLVLPTGAAVPAGGPWDQMLKPLVTRGRIARDLPPPRTIRDFVLDQLSGVPLETIRRQGLRRDF